MKMSPPLAVLGLIALSFVYMAWAHAHRVKKPSYVVVYYTVDEALEMEEPKP